MARLALKVGGVAVMAAGAELAGVGVGAGVAGAPWAQAVIRRQARNVERVFIL
jgi:hypothetical protein